MQPIELGNLKLDSNIWYAPLAGCSDFPFRRMSARYRPGLMFCEMVKMDALVRYDSGTFRLLDYSKEMHPIGGQIVGSKPELAAECARIIEDLGFDSVDLNCGCPVDKVTKDLSGSGLLKKPHLIGEILSNMSSAVSIPVTVKIRTGWDEDSIVAPLVTQIAEQAGAKAITVHGRTRQQAYKGNANWDRIKDCKQVANHIKVIGNGDLFTAHDALEMVHHTGCDGVLISRGTLGRPWIAEEIRALARGETLPLITGDRYKEELLHHLHASSLYYNDKKALIAMRRVGCWFLKEVKGARAFREKLNKSANLAQVEQLIEEYPWQSVTASSLQDESKASSSAPQQKRSQPALV